MKTLLLLGSAVAVSSCASSERVQPAFPPVADSRPAAEPAYPEAALEPCPTDSRSDSCPAQAAEDAWWNEILLWGRGESGKVARICQWGRDLGRELPEDCDPQ